MAVAFDAVGPSSSGATGSSVTTLSWTHTPNVGGVALVADAAIGVSPDTGFAATCALDPSGANTNMPSLGIQHVNNTTSGFEQLFGLANVSSGAHTVKVTVTGGTPTTIVAGSKSYTGADTASPFSTGQTAFGNSNSPSLAYTGSTAGNMVTGGMAIGSAGTITMSSGTQRWSNPFSGATGAGNAAGGDIAAGGTVTLTWVPNGTDFWAVVAVEVLAAAAAGGTAAAQPGQTWLRVFHHRQQALPGVSDAIVPEIQATRRAQPGQAWVRRFQHPQTPPTPPGPVAPVGGPSGQVQNPSTLPHRRSAARAVWDGYTSRTTNLQPGQAQPPATRQPRRSSARAVWRGFVSTTTNLLNGNAPDGVVYRRRSARGVYGGVLVPPQRPRVETGSWVSRRAAARVVWRGFVSSTTNATPAAPVSGTVPDHLVVARRASARAVWRGQGVPAPVVRTETGGLVRRRPAARAVWAGTVARTVNAIPATPINGTAPDHLVIGRRASSRVVWAGTVARTTNFIPVAGAVPDHLVVARRTAARGLWRGNPVPGRLSRPVTGGLTKRRPPARGAWRGYTSRTTNTPPPPFTIGALTAADVPRNALTTAGSSSTLTATGAGLATLTANDQRTGGPSG